MISDTLGKWMILSAYPPLPSDPCLPHGTTYSLQFPLHAPNFPFPSGSHSSSSFFPTESPFSPLLLLCSSGSASCQEEDPTCREGGTERAGGDRWTRRTGTLLNIFHTLRKWNKHGAEIHNLLFPRHGPLAGYAIPSPDSDLDVGKGIGSMCQRPNKNSNDLA